MLKFPLDLRPRSKSRCLVWFPRRRATTDEAALCLMDHMGNTVLRRLSSPDAAMARPATGGAQGALERLSALAPDRRRPQARSGPGSSAGFANANDAPRPRS